MVDNTCGMLPEADETWCRLAAGIVIWHHLKFQQSQPTVSDMLLYCSSMPIAKRFLLVQPRHDQRFGVWSCATSGIIYSKEETEPKTWILWMRVQVTWHRKPVGRNGAQTRFPASNHTAFAGCKSDDQLYLHLHTANLRTSQAVRSPGLRKTRGHVSPFGRPISSYCQVGIRALAVLT